MIQEQINFLQNLLDSTAGDDGGASTHRLHRLQSRRECDNTGRHLPYKRYDPHGPCRCLGAFWSLKALNTKPKKMAKDDSLILFDKNSRKDKLIGLKSLWLASHRQGFVAVRLGENLKQRRPENLGHWKRMVIDGHRSYEPYQIHESWFMIYHKIMMNVPNFDKWKVRSFRHHTACKYRTGALLWFSRDLQLGITWRDVMTGNDPGNGCICQGSHWSGRPLSTWDWTILSPLGHRGGAHLSPWSRRTVRRDVLGGRGVAAGGSAKGQILTELVFAEVIATCVTVNIATSGHHMSTDGRHILGPLLSALATCHRLARLCCCSQQPRDILTTAWDCSCFHRSSEPPLVVIPSLKWDDFRNAKPC